MTLRKALLLVAVIGAVAAWAGIPMRATYGAHVSGDEPQYLLTAISLGEDMSLDVSDEIAGDRYRPFHEVGLDPQSAPLEGGRLVSPHDPLLPLLLALPMLAGGWIAAKIFLGAIAGALAALTLWVSVRRFGTGLSVGTVVVGLFAASAPWAIYGHHVYPEIVAALAVMIAVAALTGPLTAPAILMVSGGVIALPWLSIKYAPVALALSVLLLWRLARRARWRLAGAVCLAFGLAAVGFAVAHVAWYGGLTPYAAGDHFVGGEFTVVGSSPNYFGRARRSIGLVIDNTFGLAAWQPAYLLAVPAVAALVRSRPRDLEVLIAPAAAGWLTATFIALTMQGWWFPGRQVVVILPLLVIAISMWLTQTPRVLLPFAVLLGAVGVVSLGWLYAEGWARRVTSIFDFHETTNPLYRGWAQMLPDYLDVSARTWVLQSVWIVLLGGAAVLAYRGAGDADREGPARITRP